MIIYKKKIPRKGKHILVIPDAHARPGVSNRRFEALGNFIHDNRPDIVVNIGDLADMASLCSYDKGTTHAEGRRYKDDIHAANDALEKMHKPLHRLKDKPKFYITLGNHENRITKAQELSPELYGQLSIDNINFKKYGYTVLPFLKPLNLEGILFQHYFTSGIMGRPISGYNHGRALTQKMHKSSVCGHTHCREFYEDVTGHGERIIGLVVGCFDEGNHHYTTEQRRWWSGIVELCEVQKGSAEPFFYNLDYLLRKYL